LNHVNNLKKHAKEQFYFNVNTILDDFSSSNSKSYWSLIKKLVKSSGDMSPISQLKKENNDLISDDYEKACLLNNYFCSISTLNDSNTSKPDFPLRTNATLDFFQITPSKVQIKQEREGNTNSITRFLKHLMTNGIQI
jgi:hypothetical protein